MLFEAPQVRLEQAKRSFGIPRIHPRSPQTDYEAFLLLNDAPPFGGEPSARQRSFKESICPNNAQGAKTGRSTHLRKNRATEAPCMRALRPIYRQAGAAAGLKLRVL